MCGSTGGALLSDAGGVQNLSARDGNHSDPARLSGGEYEDGVGWEEWPVEVT